jgi:mono/diheme cytochrome c family protein
MMHVPARTVGPAICALALVFALAAMTSTALAGDAATSTELFMGLEPSAAKGHEIIMNELMAGPIMKVKDIDRLWNVWEEEAKPKAENADHDELMRMTFERYGWVKRPADDIPTLPLGYTVDDKGNIGSNCFSCHGGKVAGETLLGAGNTHLDLTTLHTDIRRLRAFDRGRDPSLVEEVEGPFHTPLNYHKGFTNAVIFPAMIAGAQNPAFGRELTENPDLLLHHNMNPPPWWNFKKKARIYADAFAPKTPRQLMPFARSLAASDEQFHALESNFVHIYQYIEELEVPKYPFAINRDLASRGEVLFEQTCSECHGTYGADGEFPNIVVPIEEVGTDSRRFQAISQRQREAGNEGWLQYFGEHPLTVESAGYLAQPLDGIWASAPYFHNGAAPTLWAVVNPSQRPKVWRRSENGYDTLKVGLEVEELQSVPQNLSARQRRMYYDTSHVGNDAGGHTFPDVLDVEEKTAVIEYLKTL